MKFLLFLFVQQDARSSGRAGPARGGEAGQQGRGSRQNQPRAPSNIVTRERYRAVPSYLLRPQCCQRFRFNSFDLILWHPNPGLALESKNWNFLKVAYQLRIRAVKC